MMFFVLLSNLMDLLFFAGIVAFVVKLIAKKKNVSQRDIYKQMYSNAKKAMNNVSDFIKKEKQNYNQTKSDKKTTVFYEPETEK